MDSPLYLNGIVTFIDCLNIHRFLQGNSLDLGEISTKQIASADALILNKTDLVDQTHLLEVTKSVTSLNSTASIITTAFSNVPWDILFNLNAFESTQRKWPDVPHAHFQGIDHIFLKVPANCISPESATRAVGELLWERKAGEIYRCKGLFEFDEKWFSLQGVGELFEVSQITFVDEAKIDADRSGRFLFIGKNLDSKVIADVLR